MPMPHRTFAQVAKRRLVGKEGRERIRWTRSVMFATALPDAPSQRSKLITPDPPPEQSPLSQSLPLLQCSPSLQVGHTPPQSTSVSF